MSKSRRAGGALPLSISQNYLTSKTTIQRLLKKTTIDREDQVLEIGAGKGHITRELEKICKRVIAYELDGKLYANLQKKMEGCDKVRVVHGDFLKAKLPEKQKYKVFSNIPFSITTALVNKLLTDRNPPEEAWLVMEKGAGKRFFGKPHDTLSSMLIKPFFDAEIVYHLRKEDFHPSPSVDTVLLHFRKKEQPDIPVVQRNEYRKFVESGMQYGIRRLLTKRQITAALRAGKLPSIQQSKTMLYVQWLCLFRYYRRLNGG